MEKKLIRTGNSLALVLEKPLLERLDITAETPLEVSTDGDVIVISPIRGARRTAKLKRVMARVHERYAGAFKRLAE
jgi:antitoxin component of MazEF toxin-antitoxin module